MRCVEELSGALVCIKGNMKHLFMLLSRSPSLFFGAFLVNCDVRVQCVQCACAYTWLDIMLILNQFNEMKTPASDVCTS